MHRSRKQRLRTDEKKGRGKKKNVDPAANLAFRTPVEEFFKRRPTISISRASTVQTFALALISSDYQSYHRRSDFVRKGSRDR